MMSHVSHILEMSPLSEGFLGFINSHHNFALKIVDFGLVCFGFLFSVKNSMQFIMD